MVISLCQKKQSMNSQYAHTTAVLVESAERYRRTFYLLCFHGDMLGCRQRQVSWFATIRGQLRKNSCLMQIGLGFFPACFVAKYPLPMFSFHLCLVQFMPRFKFD